MSYSNFLDDADLFERILRHLKDGTYRLSEHAIERQEEKGIDLHDIIHVLKRGEHEKKKTRQECGIWKYAIKGKVEGLNTIRVIVAIDSEMIIITVIRL